jgi:hypothetical protein
LYLFLGSQDHIKYVLILLVFFFIFLHERAHFCHFPEMIHQTKRISSIGTVHLTYTSSDNIPQSLHQEKRKSQCDKTGGQQQPLQCEYSPEQKNKKKKISTFGILAQKIPITDKRLLTSTTTWPAKSVLLAKILLLPILQS